MINVYIELVTFAFHPQLYAHAHVLWLSFRGTMAADTALLLSLVEEYVSGLQDSKAKDTAKGTQVFIPFSLSPTQNSSLRKKRCCGC